MAGYIGTGVASLSTTGADIDGNITVDGTVDGRDVSVDGTKLDGIEASATADQTNAEIKTAVEAGADISLGGNPTTTTQSAGNNTTRVATTAFTQAAITALVDSSPASLNTLNELAAALGDDANFSTTVTNSIAAKLPLAGGALTGNVTFGDSNKIVMGAGSDLNVFHNGSHSYVQDSGTGNLYLAGSNVIISNPTSSETMAYFDDDGGASLWYNNAVKIATTNTGVAVTGNLTTSGETRTTNINTASSTGTLTMFGGSSNKGGMIELSGGNNTGATGSGIVFKTGASTANPPERMRITSTGDILAKTADARIGSDVGSVEYGTSTNNSVRFYSNNAERFRLEGSGKVTIAAGAELLTTTAGVHNLRLGLDAGIGILSGGGYNQFIGRFAGKACTTGDANTGLGDQALKQATTPSGNTAIGSSTLESCILSESNTAIGNAALNGHTGTTGSSLVDGYNTAVGHRAGVALGVGRTATLIGAFAGDALDGEYRCTAVGYVAGRNTGKNCTTLGVAAGLITTGDNNCMIGQYNDSSGGSGEYITSGGYHTVIGNFGGNATNSHGANVDIRTQNNTASISDGSGNLAFIKWSDGISYFFKGIRPWLGDAIDLGGGSNQFDNIFATNATINTSDRTLKQDEAVLSSTEMAVAARISGLFKNFRWKSAVAAKGDDARTHSGVIAQDVVAAFAAEGLNSRDYALFTSSDWWTHPRVEPASPEVLHPAKVNIDGSVEASTVRHAAIAEYTTDEKFDTEAEAPDGATKHTRLGIRYTELLAFLAAYNEQRFAAIETRITALEA